jgi:uncharacterized protein YcgI (DUF1989 family)
VSCLFYNADEPTERYNAADTVKIQNMIFLTAGRVLFSDMGTRPLLDQPPTRAGTHDTLGGGSTPGDEPSPATATATISACRNDRHRDARTNFLYALGTPRARDRATSCRT